MHKILQRIDGRFKLMREQADDLSWKSMPDLTQHMRMNNNEGEVGPGYHALRHIAGPCTNHPVWAKDWEAPNGHLYRKGEPAPQWTQQEIHVAMAPQIRTWARSQANTAFGAKHGARKNYAWIDDIAMNIHQALQRALEMEKDEGRVLSGGGFVSWISSLIRDFGETGIGGTNAERNAKGRVGDPNTVDGKTLLHTKSPEIARKIASTVGPAYQTKASHKQDPENPYGQFSSAIYQLGTKLADALEAKDQGQVDAVRKEILALNEKIRDAEILVQGTDTGRRTISTPHGAEEGGEAKKDLDKFMHTGIGSVDTPVGDQGNTVGSMLVGQKGLDMTGMDKEIIFKVLQLGRSFAHEKNPKILAHLQADGLIPISDGDFRYLIRLLSPWLPDGNYPDKGNPEKDPELQNGQPNKWIQDGQPHLMDPTEIMQDIASNPTGGGITMVQIAQMAKPPLTAVEADFVALMCGIHPEHPGKPMTKAEISRFRGCSKVNVGNKISGAEKKLNAVMAQIMPKLQAIAGGGGGKGADSQVSKDPLGVFQAWMKQYMAEEELDESVSKCWIDQRIITECYFAVSRLHYWVKIKPIIEGKTAKVILSRRVLGRA